MSILTIIVIFVVGFLMLYAAYRYGGDNIIKYAVYIIVMIVFVIVLLNLAGVIPSNFLNHRV